MLHVVPGTMLNPFFPQFQKWNTYFDGKLQNNSSKNGLNPHRWRLLTTCVVHGHWRRGKSGQGGDEARGQLLSL